MDQHAHAFILRVRPLCDSKVIGKGIYQCSFEMTVTGMHHHAGRLVHDQKVFIFIYYVKRNVLREHLETTPLVRHDKTYHITRSHYQIRFRRLVIDLYVTVLYRKLHAVAGRVHQMARHILVYTERSLSLVHIEPEMLEHPLLILFRSTFLPFFDD